MWEMKLKTPFFINIEKNEIDYVKDVYKQLIQNEIDSYVDQEEKIDTVVAQDILYLHKVFI